MAHLNATLSADTSDDARWANELDDLLARAAELASEHDLDPDEFVQAAWAALLDARPGLREQIEDKELRSQLRKLRKRGLVGLA